MSFVEQFDASMIETALRDLGLHFYRDDDGDLVAWFLGQQTGAPVRAEFTVEGAGYDIYVVRVVAGRYFPPEDWPRLLGLLNQWQIENRWPRVCLAHLPEGRFAAVHCEGQLHLKVGVHQRLVTSFTDTVLGTTSAFWHWLIERIPKPPLLSETWDLNQTELNLGTDPGVFGT